MCIKVPLIPEKNLDKFKSTPKLKEHIFVYLSMHGVKCFDEHRTYKISDKKETRYGY